MKQKDIRKVRSLLNRCTFLVSFSIFLIYFMCGYLTRFSANSIDT